MAINDLYHVIFEQRVLGTTEPILTNWFYQGVALACTAESLAGAFTAEGGMVDLINAVQAPAMQNVGLKVLNLFSLTDFYEQDVPGGGTVAGDMLPVFNNIVLVKKLDTRGVRPGRVSIPGVIEALQSAGVISDAGYISEINNLIEAMVEDITVDVDEIYDPVVIKRVPYTLPATETLPERTAYRLPTSAEEANFGHVNAVLFNRRVSHVVSRGNGR